MHAKSLAQSHTDGRSSLNDYVFGRIAQSTPYILGVVFLRQRTGGADNDTLAAGYAGHVGQVLVKGGADMGVKAPAVRSDDRNILPFGAGGGTAAAQHALGVVAHHMYGGIVVIAGGLFAVEDRFVVDAEVLTQFLQLTVAGAYAGQAGSVMGGKDQLQVGFTRSENTLGVGQDLHALSHRINTGGDQVSHTDYFYYADAAGADLVDFS